MAVILTNRRSDGVSSAEQTVVIWQIINNDHSASVSDHLLIDSTVSGIVIEMPANPVLGNSVYFLDMAGNCSNYNVTISGSGKKIMGLSESYYINSDEAHFSLVYSNETYGWRIY